MKVHNLTSQHPREHTRTLPNRPDRKQKVDGGEMLEKSPAGCLGRAAIVLPGGFLVTISPRVRVECAGLELVVGGGLSGISPRLASSLRPGASYTVLSQMHSFRPNWIQPPREVLHFSAYKKQGSSLLQGAEHYATQITVTSKNVIESHISCSATSFAKENWQFQVIWNCASQITVTI
jgi:hypothetical protein